MTLLSANQIAYIFRANDNIIYSVIGLLKYIYYLQKTITKK